MSEVNDEVDDPLEWENKVCLQCGRRTWLAWPPSAKVEWCPLCVILSDAGWKTTIEKQEKPKTP